MTCHDARENAAIALITRQPPDTDTAAHLAICADCAREAGRLAPLPALLDLVADPALRHPEPPGDHLLERMLQQVGRRRRRRRTIGLAVAATAIMALAVPLGRAALHTTDRTGPRAPATALAAPVLVRSADDPRTGIWAKVQLRRAAWGSDLVFDIGGVQPGVRCRLLVITRDGGSEVAGSWAATADESWTVHGSVAAEPDQITAIQLVDDSNGRLLLPLPLV